VYSLVDHLRDSVRSFCLYLCVRRDKFHHADSLVSLASSGDSDDGALAPPPRKKSRIVEVNMQQPQQPQQQLQSASNGCSQHNGATSDEIAPKMDRTNQDIVRLIGQHLKTIGLKYVSNRNLILRRHFTIWLVIVIKNSTPFKT